MTKTFTLSYINKVKKLISKFPTHDFLCQEVSFDENENIILAVPEANLILILDKNGKKLKVFYSGSKKKVQKKYQNIFLKI